MCSNGIVTALLHIQVFAIKMQGERISSIRIRRTIKGRNDIACIFHIEHGNTRIWVKTCDGRSRCENRGHAVACANITFGSQLSSDDSTLRMTNELNGFITADSGHIHGSFHRTKLI